MLTVLGCWISVFGFRVCFGGTKTRWWCVPLCVVANSVASRGDRALRWQLLEPVRANSFTPEVSFGPIFAGIEAHQTTIILRTTSTSGTNSSGAYIKPDRNLSVPVSHVCLILRRPDLKGCLSCSVHAFLRSVRDAMQCCDDGGPADLLAVHIRPQRICAPQRRVKTAVVKNTLHAASHKSHCFELSLGEHGRQFYHNVLLTHVCI